MAALNPKVSEANAQRTKGHQEAIQKRR